MPADLSLNQEKTFVNEFGKTYGKVTLHVAPRALVMEWYGYTTKHQIEEVAFWVETLIQHFPFDTLLNDCSQIISVWDDTIYWFSQVWLVKMQRLGVIRLIHIAKPGSFGYTIGKRLNIEKPESLEFIFFSTSQEITNWLQMNDKGENHLVN